MADGLAYSRSEAILKLFRIKLTDFPKFKNKIATLEDKACISLEVEKATGATGSRGKRFYLPRQLNRLHNIILISGFYSKPAIVKDVADKLNRRQEHVAALRELLAGRDRIGNIQFDVGALTQFLNCLESCQSLDDQRLPNPFIQLPQVIDSGSGQFPCVLDAYNSADMALTQVEKMLAAYLDYDIELAYQLSSSLEDSAGSSLKIKQWIEREYHEAQRFDDVLESFFD
ncbi:MAG: hypothetical protein RPS47_05130 [Colwellia sp.]